MILKKVQNNYIQRNVQNKYKNKYRTNSKQIHIIFKTNTTQIQNKHKTYINNILTIS